MLWKCWEPLKRKLPTTQQGRVSVSWGCQTKALRPRCSGRHCRSSGGQSLSSGTRGVCPRALLGQQVAFSLCASQVRTPRIQPVGRGRCAGMWAGVFLKTLTQEPWASKL